MTRYNALIQLLEIKLFDHFPQILTHDDMLAPKMNQIRPFYQKLSILTKKLIPSVMKITFQ